jgi:hypothetical protein
MEKEEKGRTKDEQPTEKSEIKLNNRRDREEGDGWRWRKAAWGLGGIGLFLPIWDWAILPICSQFTPILSHNFIGSDEGRKFVDQLNGNGTE